MQGAGVTWATIPMGAASGADEFWQLFVLPAGGSPWFLRTPPNVAANGAIVLTAPDAVGPRRLGQDGRVCREDPRSRGAAQP